MILSMFMMLSRVSPEQRVFGCDVWAYLRAGERVAAGVSPYHPDMVAGPIGNQGLDRFRYPPVVALLFVPLAALPDDVATWIWLILGYLGFLAAGLIATRAAAGQIDCSKIPLVALLIVAFSPIFDALWKGNVEGAQAVLVAIALAVEHPIARGASLAAGGWLKVAPGALVINGFLHDRRTARGVVAVFAGVLASVPLVLSGWADYPAAFANIVGASNESRENLAPSAIVATHLPNLPWLEFPTRVAALFIAGALLLGSWRLARQGRERWARSLLAGLCGAILVPSTIWLHYLGILFPLLVLAWLLGGRAERFGMLACYGGLWFALYSLDPPIFAPASVGVSALLCLFAWRALGRVDRGSPSSSVARDET